MLFLQDTIKSPPAEYKTMKKATLLSIVVTTVFYLLCGCFGYAAFGDDAPGNLLTGFGFYNPYWLLDIANVAIVIHLVGAYQVHCPEQRVFKCIFIFEFSFTKHLTHQCKRKIWCTAGILPATICVCGKMECTKVGKE